MPKSLSPRRCPPARQMHPHVSPCHQIMNAAMNEACPHLVWGLVSPAGDVGKMDW